MIASPLRAHAGDVDLAWTAPAGCPGRESMREWLSQRVGRPLAFGSDATVRLQGAIAARPLGYTLELVASVDGASETRTLSARGCGELARAAVLSWSLTLLHTGDAQRKAPAVSAALSDDAPLPDAPAGTWAVRARLGSDLGTFPRPAFGPVLALGWIWPALEIELAGSYLLEQQLEGPSQEVAGSAQRWAASAGVCRELWSAVHLAPCAAFEVGRLIVEGREGSKIQNPERATGTWLLVQFGARLAVPLGLGLHWQSELGLGIPLRRFELASHELGTIARVSSVTGRFATGLEYRFP